MILAQLAALYERLAAAGLIERDGYERRPIAFLLVIDSHGKLRGVHDTRETAGPAKRGRMCSVPQAINRGSAIAPKLLWGNREYVLGLPNEDNPDERRRRRVAEAHNAFKARVYELTASVPDDLAVAAVSAFLEAHDPARFLSAPYATTIEPGVDISFVFEPEPNRLVCEGESVRAWLTAQGGDVLPPGQCLVSGRIEPIQRLHKEISGLGGASPGRRLVSFDDPAFKSYGFDRGDNAPVGAATAYGYTSALNWLLAEPRHRLRLGQLAVVAWAGTDTPAETFLADVFGEPPRDETEADRTARVARVRELLAAPRTGISPDALETDFFVLGLAPNAARVAVALWEQGRLADMVNRVRGWFADLELVGRPSFMPDTFSLPALLRALAPLGEVDHLPPRTAASLLSAALTGQRLPQELLGWALARLRLSRGAAAYSLTALLRVLLRRNHAMESTVSLDPSATDRAYLWGRLFAVFEKAQEEAQPGIDATVRDRFWGSAAATPQLVFPVLSRLNGHHLRKLDQPARIRLERLSGEIMGGVRDFPARLSLAEQGRFALGYWHQRTALFTRREPTAIPAENAA